PSINVMATHVAARTKNVRIGMAVSLAAFYHPLRLAEEVALVDVLSAGRVNWGAGRGFDRHEFQAFGVPPEESSDRFRECVEIVLAGVAQRAPELRRTLLDIRRRRGAAGAAADAAPTGGGGRQL